MLKKALPILVLLLCAATAAGCGGGGNAGSAANAGGRPASGESAPDGGAAALYKANCVSCHGADLQGRIGPNLQKVGARLSEEQIAGKIANGGGGMVSFKGTLSDDKIKQLAEWLAGKKGETGR